nr:IS110 family transposase [Mycobacterium tuberculosis]
MCRLHLAHLDQLDAMIGALDEQIEQLMHPFCARRELIASIPGIGVGASATVISEIGADPAAWFPSAEHLASWVRLCPGNHESAGKRHHGARRKGNQHLQPVLVECAWAAVRTDGYLREYYRRQVRKFGGFRSPAANKKAIIAVEQTRLRCSRRRVTLAVVTLIHVPAPIFVPKWGLLRLLACLRAGRSGCSRSSMPRTPLAR